MDTLSTADRFAAELFERTLRLEGDPWTVTELPVDMDGDPAALLPGAAPMSQGRDEPDLRVELRAAILSTAFGYRVLRADEDFSREGHASLKPPSPLLVRLLPGNPETGSMFVRWDGATTRRGPVAESRSRLARALRAQGWAVGQSGSGDLEVGWAGTAVGTARRVEGTEPIAAE